MLATFEKAQHAARMPFLSFFTRSLYNLEVDIVLTHQSTSVEGQHKRIRGTIVPNLVGAAHLSLGLELKDHQWRRTQWSDLRRPRQEERGELQSLGTAIGLGPLLTRPHHLSD